MPSRSKSIPTLTTSISTTVHPSESGRQPRPLDVGLLFPVLPPALDGIGDYTARLAEALTAHVRVRILTAQNDPDPIPGVVVHTAFRADPPRAVMALADVLEADPPDWLVIQFNQFSYGRWGFNPFLPLAIRAIKKRCPELRIAWMAHEDFVPITSWKFALMTTWQRAQFFALGRLADLIFFSIDPWVRKYASWFPGTEVRHLPVGSNFKRAEQDRDQARRTLGITPDTFVVGVFGTMRSARLLPLIVQAVRGLAAACPSLQLLYVGPDGEVLRGAVSDVPVWDAGRLPASEVPRYLRAMDLHLCPFIDGVSTRRGSFMAGIQQGVASVTNLDVNSDDVLRDVAGRAFAAVPQADPDLYTAEVLRLYRNPSLRHRIAEEGAALYTSTFSFEYAAERLIAALQEVEAGH